MRLFIAVNFNDGTKDRLLTLCDQLRSRSESGRFSAPSVLHLTLAFLGECDGRQAAGAKSAMDAVKFERVDITIERVGRFKRNGGDIWWAGVTESKPLISLQRDLAEKLIAANFALDQRRYNPHITLGREVITDAQPWKIAPFCETVATEVLLELHLSLLSMSGPLGENLTSLPTVNARWGNIVAVMGGDLMLSGAALKLTHIDNRLTQTALRVVAEMTHAAIAEVEARGNLLLSIEQLKRIAEGKTGALFGWCGAAAAILAGNLAAQEQLNAFGRRLGVVFQMADDVKDITGADEGKPQFADLQSKTPSLLVLLAAQRSPSVMKRFKEAWGFPTVTRERTRELGLAVMCSGALDEAMELMEREMEAALKLLGDYTQTPSGSLLVLWTREFAKDMFSKRGAA